MTSAVTPFGRERATWISPDGVRFHALVILIGQRDREHVDVGAFQEFFVVGDELEDAEMVGCLTTALGGNLGEGDDLGGRM